MKRFVLILILSCVSCINTSTLFPASAAESCMRGAVSATDIELFLDKTIKKSARQDALSDQSCVDIIVMLEKDLAHLTKTITGESSVSYLKTIHQCFVLRNRLFRKILRRFEVPYKDSEKKTLRFFAEAACASWEQWGEFWARIYTAIMDRCPDDETLAWIESQTSDFESRFRALIEEDLARYITLFFPSDKALRQRIQRMKDNLLVVRVDARGERVDSVATRLSRIKHLHLKKSFEGVGISGRERGLFIDVCNKKLQESRRGSIVMRDPLLALRVFETTPTQFDAISVFDAFAYQRCYLLDFLDGVATHFEKNVKLYDDDSENVIDRLFDHIFSQFKYAVELYEKLSSQHNKTVIELEKRAQSLRKSAHRDYHEKSAELSETLAKRAALEKSKGERFERIELSFQEDWSDLMALSQRIGQACYTAPDSDWFTKRCDINRTLWGVAGDILKPKQSHRASQRELREREHAPESDETSCGFFHMDDLLSSV